MNAFTRSIRGYLADARDAFAYAPLEIAMGIVVAITFSISIRADGQEGEWWVRVFAAAIIALPLVFAASVLRARGVIGAGTRWALSAGVLMGVALYARFVFDPDLESEGWRAAALAASAWLALTWAPLPGVAGEEGQRRAFWRFNAMLVTRILTVGLYGAAMYAALAGAISAVTTLFELRTPSHLFGDLAGIIFFALVPWLVAGGVPDLTAAPRADGVVPLTAVRRVGRYLYAVVLVIYLAILFAYTIKVLATGDFPKNVLSPIVLFAGLAGLLGGMLLEPLHDDAESAGVARLVRTFPALLLPLLPLPVWAVWMRRGQYGWTEFRYLRFTLLATLLVLAAWGTVLLVRRRRPLLIQIPAALAVALTLASLGPWSAQAVSRRDQSGRLRVALTDAGLLRGGRLTRALLPPKTEPARRITLPAERYDAVSGSLEYLYRAHGSAAVSRVMGASVDGYGWPQAVLTSLAVARGCAREGVRELGASLPDSVPIPIAAGVLHRIATGPAGDTTRGLRATRAGTTVTVERAGMWSARVDVAPILRQLDARNPGACWEEYGRGRADLAPATARFPLVDQAGRARGELIVSSVHFTNSRVGAGRAPRTGPMRLERLDGMVLLHE
ncbi:MAG TPA: DUF4153 domain-containing protein [Longimicrobium sp.]|nr:DUF4153 domain-containing protein [Longimicrobium sp.]